MVFPAQSGSKLWPSLCAFKNPVHCHSDSPPRFSNSISLPPPTPSQSHSDPLSTHGTSCSRYSEIWERSGNLEHLNYCTVGRCSVPPTHHRKTSLMLRRGGGGGGPFVFLSCWRSSKSAERRLTCLPMKRLLSYRPCSWFTSPLPGLITRLGGDASARRVTGRATPACDLFP